MEKIMFIEGYRYKVVDGYVTIRNRIYKVVRCAGHDIYACNKHIIKYGKEKWCLECRKLSDLDSARRYREKIKEKNIGANK